MAEEKPTPGPWRADPWQTRFHIRSNWSGCEGHQDLVAEVVENQEGPARTRANAALIAAAAEAAELLADLEQNPWIPMRIQKRIRAWQRKAGLRDDREEASDASKTARFRRASPHAQNGRCENCCA